MLGGGGACTSTIAEAGKLWQQFIHFMILIFSCSRDLYTTFMMYQGTRAYLLFCETNYCQHYRHLSHLRTACRILIQEGYFDDNKSGVREKERGESERARETPELTH